MPVDLVISPTVPAPDFERVQGDDAYLARLPFDLAQIELSGPPIGGTAIRVALTWHGTSLDPERGCFAIVRADGPAAEMVGERLLVTVPFGPAHVKHSVAVYCHAERVLRDDEDLSLPRPIFARLATLSSEPVPARVETLA